MISLVLKEGVELPKYETENSAGFDVRANNIIKAYKGTVEVDEERLEKIKESFEKRGYIKMRAHERILFGTGITVADMPADVEIQVRPRSGLSLKTGLMVSNSPGTIDADYRGEIGIILYNSTPYLNQVNKDTRIAQLVTAKVHKEEFGKTSEVIETIRGAGSFGSTGMN